MNRSRADKCLKCGESRGAIMNDKLICWDGYDELGKHRFTAWPTAPVPSTSTLREQVREGWQKFSAWKRVPTSGAEQSGAEFDAWLAGEIAEAEQRGAAKALNLAAVLAALDDILSDWTLHPRAEASAMKVRLRKLRAHIAEYRTPKEPNND